MKIIYTTKQEKILVDDEDYFKLLNYSWFIDSNGYARRTDYTQGKIYKNRKKPLRAVKIHREILNYFGSKDIDHIDGNKLNNQKTNLRIVNRSQNGLNRNKLNINNKTGFRGISYHKQGKIKKRWVARFRGKLLGYFELKEQAINAMKGVLIY